MSKKIIKYSFIFIAISASVFIGNVKESGAQTNVTLFSVSPSSGREGTQITITGSNLGQCSPLSDVRCNVMFYDLDVRRTTISGTETSNSTVTATVPDELCPGRYTIKVGEVLNFSNTVPFTVLERIIPQAADQSSFYCRYIRSITPVNASTGTTITISGLNLHTNVIFFNSSGAIAGTATGTVATTYQVDLGADGVQTWISSLRVVVPANLTPGAYKIRVGTNQLITVNSTAPIQVADISNAVDFGVLTTISNLVISNVRASSITDTTATITWDTNVPADSQVEYCTTVTQCGISSVRDTNMVTGHSVALSGLIPGQYYFYWVKSADSTGYRRTAGYYSFTTRTNTPSPTPRPTPTPTPPRQAPPVISNFQILNITRDSVTVSWNTDIPADSRVSMCYVYVLCFSGGYDATPVTDHTMTVVGLRASTNYSVRARSRVGDASSRSSALDFTTEPGIVISNMQIQNITSNSITVSWDTNFPATSRLGVCFLPMLCMGGSASDTNLVTNHSLTVTGLVNNRQYYYFVRAVDGAGYRASARGVYFRTLP